MIIKKYGRKIFIALSTLLLIFEFETAYASSSNASWIPQSSERLVKLPAQYLKKRMENDFTRSGLGKALAKAEANISGKGNTLRELQEAIRNANGEIKTELRHQFLAQKQEYIEMMKELNSFRRQKLNTGLKVYNQLLNKSNVAGPNLSKSRQKLIEAQKAAMLRFKKSADKVDLETLKSVTFTESNYTVKYTENMAAIEKLATQIQNHKTKNSRNEGQINKGDYIRQVIADSQAELAILDQENSILGYMAKLVSLDALQMADEILEHEQETSTHSRPKMSPASATEFFIHN